MGVAALLSLAALLVSAGPAAASHAFTAQWGSLGAGDGQFNQPYSVAVDASGNVYVADHMNDRIQKFNSDGAFITKWGTPGTAEGQFDEPRGVALDTAGNVYVADPRNYRVQKFNSNGVFERMWGRGVDTGATVFEVCTSGCQIGSPSFIDGAFNGPAGLVTDSAGNVYVPDTGNHRIQKFTSNGAFITKWGSFGTADGQFNDPLDVGIDASDALYVADGNNGRIQKFTSSGVFITKWGSLGPANGQFTFSGGGGAAVDPAGNVFVADYGSNRIQGFTADGAFLETFAGPGTAPAPADLAFGPTGILYVVNRFPHNVQKFTVASGGGPLIPAPVLGRSVNAVPQRGTVLVSVPPGAARAAQVKGRRFVPLSEARQIPVGSLLDTRKGTVGLTSAKDAAGTTQSGDFSSGIFQVLQSRRAKGLTELRLKGSSFKRCTATGRGKRASLARKRLSSRSVRRLRANAKGRFRTRGKHSAATVRGTIWTTTDRCDGTLTKVGRGKVAVRDFRRKKTIVVKAGKSYLARAKR